MNKLFQSRHVEVPRECQIRARFRFDERQHRKHWKTFPNRADPSRCHRNWSDELGSTLAFSMKPPAQRSSSLELDCPEYEDGRKNFPQRARCTMYAQHKLNLHYGLKSRPTMVEASRQKKIINQRGSIANDPMRPMTMNTRWVVR